MREAFFQGAELRSKGWRQLLRMSRPSRRSRPLLQFRGKPSRLKPGHPVEASGGQRQLPAHSTGTLFGNHVSAPRNAGMVGLAAVNEGITQAYFVDMITDAILVEQIIAANG